MPSWSTADLAAIGAAEEIQLAVQRATSAPAPPVTIWIVRLGDDLYIRSGYGSRASWYRRAARRPTGRVRAGEIDRLVKFVPADPALTADIDAAYRTKYRRYPSSILGPMTAPDAAASTLRVEPIDSGPADNI